MKKLLKFCVITLVFLLAVSTFLACKLEHDHSIVTDSAVSATCTETGLTEGSHCSGCGKIMDEQEIIPANGHTASTEYSKDSEGHWKICTVCGLTAVAKAAHTPASGACTVCGYNTGSESGGNGTYTRVDGNGSESATGNYILFGTYPQSEVTGTIAADLTSLSGSRPTSTVPGAWKSYKYYVGTGSTGSQSNAVDYMWYQDISYGGEWYRGVYFTQYRPSSTDYISSTDNTHQDNNGYTTGNVYWFKYEPIKWRILSEENGEALILCEMLIDSQEYYDNYDSRTINGSTVYANNYEHSNIRKWLNNEFYNTAFNGLERELILLTAVDNSVASTGYTSNSYVCPDTEDYIFLPSAKEVMTADYGFTTSTSSTSTRYKKTTSYAQCQGAYIYSGGSYAGNDRWWLRSPEDNRSVFARAVGRDGDGSGSNCVNYTLGVCPALRIRL